jgi:hypothetical protein
MNKIEIYNIIGRYHIVVNKNKQTIYEGTLDECIDYVKKLN